jgi:hypothetical protein
MSKSESHTSKIDEYRAVVDAIYGSYLDARDGFAHVLDKAEKSRDETKLRIENLIAENPKYAGVTYGGLDHSYGRRVPAGTRTYSHLHQVPIEELIRRNGEGGPNLQIVGNTSLVVVYQYWEDHYRAAIASELQVEPAQIQIPVFGELRRFRQAILHHQAIATSEVEKCERFKWFKRGDKIVLSREQFELVVDGLLEALNGLKDNPQSYIMTPA